mgnify:CR=1 FL=1
MQAESFFYFVTVAVIADLLGLPTIRAVIISVDAALGVGLLFDAIARAVDVTFVDFNDSLPCGVCQCVVAGRPRCLAALTPAKPRDHRAGAVHPAAGPCGSELRTLIRMGVKIIEII